jgi:flagellar basal-body rod protein FlgG
VGRELLAAGGLFDAGATLAVTAALSVQLVAYQAGIRGEKIDAERGKSAGLVPGTGFFVKAYCCKDVPNGPSEFALVGRERFRYRSADPAWQADRRADSRPWSRAGREAAMAFIKRASAAGLTLVAVACILVAGHRLAGTLHSQPVQPAYKLLDAEDMGYFPSESDRVFPTIDEAFVSQASATIDGAPKSSTPNPTTIAPRPTTCCRTNQPEPKKATVSLIPGPIGPVALPKTSRPTPPAPLPLPARTNVSHVPLQEPELPPLRDFSKGSQKSNSSAARSGSNDELGPGSKGRKIIERELPDSSAEERELWHEMLKDLPLNDLRELLKIREQFGRLPPSILESRAPLYPPFTGITDPRDVRRGLPPEASSSLSPSGGRATDTSRVINETLTAVNEARRAVVNNIANANTMGYKRTIVSFESAWQKASPASPPIEAGARFAPRLFDMSQGKLRRTDRSLDLAIDGDGFFQTMDSPSGKIHYTRSGRFNLDSSGKLVLRSQGREWVLVPSVTIPQGATNIQVGLDGEVKIVEPPNEPAVMVGVIQLARFDADSRLLPVEGGIFDLSDGRQPHFANPGIADHGRIRQGWLEESNVDPKQELEELERLERHVEAVEQAARVLGIDVAGNRKQRRTNSD